MANYTTPKTWTVGEVATSADLNTYVRDNVAYLAKDRPKVRVYRSSDQTGIVTATDTVIDFTSEAYKNVAGLHDNSTNPSRITVPSGYDGLWLFSTTITFAANNTGYRRVNLLYNGSTVVAESKVLAVTGTQSTTVTLTSAYQMAATDYMQVRVTQTSGGNLSVSALTDYSPVFSATWLMI